MRISDCSSDVCSSDLIGLDAAVRVAVVGEGIEPVGDLRLRLQLEAGRPDPVDVDQNLRADRTDEHEVERVLVLRRVEGAVQAQAASEPIALEAGLEGLGLLQIGSASCRERVCQKV